MRTTLLYILIFSLLLSVLSCTGGEVSGEMSGKFETKGSLSYTETINGKVTKKTETKKNDSGAFETDVNVLIGDSDSLSTTNTTPALNTKINCTQSLSNINLEQLKQRLLSQTLDKQRILIAKLAINEWCLSSNQVRDLLALFTMDKYRLDFAKFAYGHTTDRINYNRVKDAFSMDGSKKLLDNYINTL
jgi:hypothetical protein